MNQYIFAVTQVQHLSVMAESEAEAWSIVNEEDLSDISKPDEMWWDLVEVVMEGDDD